MDTVQLQNQINDLNNAIASERLNFNNERTNYNNQTQSLQEQINNLNNSFNNERSGLNNQISQNNTNFENERASLKSQVTSFQTAIIQKDSEISETKNENQRLQKMIETDAKEVVKVLSANYDEYADRISKKVTFWLVAVISALLLIIGWTVKTYIDYNNKVGHVTIATESTIIIEKKDDKTESIDRLVNIVPNIVLDIVFIYVLYFVVQQCLYQTKLLTEYRNRGVVAKSYLGVLNNITDQEMRNKSSEVIIQTLFSRASVEIGSELPIKEALKIAQNFTQKG